RRARRSRARSCRAILPVGAPSSSLRLRTPSTPRRRHPASRGSRRRARSSGRPWPTPRGRRRGRTGSRPAGGCRRLLSSPRSTHRTRTRARHRSFRLSPACNIDGMIRIAGAGDLHASEATRERVERAFETVAEEADVILLAGDLTTTGEPEQAEVVADACRELTVPVFAVLGNHDVHVDRADEVRAVVEAAGVHVLERSWRTCS